MARKFSHEEIVPVAAEYDKTGEVKKRIYVLYIVHCTCSMSSSSFFPFLLNKSVCFSVSLGNHQEGTFSRTIEWPYPRELW